MNTTLKRSFLVLTGTVVGLCVLAPFLRSAVSLFLFVWASSESTLLVDQTFPVGEYVVRETIHQDGMGWPDHRMLRQYTVTADTTYDLGDYENESERGISPDSPPQMVGDRLVVYSSSHVYLWRLGEAPIEFNPYKAENWNDVFPGTLNGPNGHYDYVADAFSVEVKEGNPRWLITYRCIHPSCACTDTACETYAPEDKAKPTALTFYSDDEGEHFYVLPPENYA